MIKVRSEKNRSERGFLSLLGAGDTCRRLLPIFKNTSRQFKGFRWRKYWTIKYTESSLKISVLYLQPTLIPLFNYN